MNSRINSSRPAILGGILLVAITVATARAESPADKLDALPGFKIEHLLKADPKVNGSWINLAKDNKGRLLLGGQRGQPVTRVTLKDGQVEKQEDVKLPISETMGLLYAFDSLYVTGFGKNNEGKGVFGFFRCKEGADGTYSDVQFLREWKGGAGEHGAHGIVLGPDKKLYVVCGNFTGLPDDLLPSSPHRNYADDRVLPRAEDGNGFGAGHKPPGGWIVRMDPDGKNAELFASGQRNCYDIAFNADGELFGFDSDMEWDWGMPWYRPVRVFHAISGGDQGFREGTAKWPEYYPDSLPCSVTIGIGCPTGVVFGTGAKFPAKYQKAFYICDWTYGRLIAVHLTPKGAAYGGSWENFVAPKGLKGNGPKSPLNLTDVVVGEDGAMYFTIGGRGTGAGLFRVSYTGTEPTAAVDSHDAEGAEARAARHKLEDLHAKVDAGTVDAAWPSLASPDRWIRYAARIAIERQPVEMWKSKALAEKNPNAALTSLLALARLGKTEDQPAIFAALAKIPISGLDEATQLEKIRVVEVSVARQGKPAADVSKAVADELNGIYPSKSIDLNRELSQTLIALEVPDAVAKTVDLLTKAPTQEEQISYVLFLRNAKAGWTPDLRKQYFTWWSNKDRTKGHPDYVTKWFEDAGRGYADGSSFPKFLGNFFNDAKASLSPDEQTALADVLAAYTPPGKPAPKKIVARKLVKEYAMADLQPLLEQVNKGRSFDRGKDVYEQAQCAACHKFGNAGGSVGPELTAIASRFQPRDILESIIEPSKVISEQFQNTTIKTNDGKLVEGRVVDENDARVVVQPNQLLPEKVEVKKDNIKSRAPSKLSPMPEGLVNNFHQDEILDLLAYLVSGGRKDYVAFGNPGKVADVTTRVAAEIKGNKLSVTASNEFFGGDPAEGQVKKLKIEYTIGDEAQTKISGEGEAVEIVAPADKKIFVKRAQYGVGF
jgi:putative heme-binding domain-containing protein